MPSGVARSPEIDGDNDNGEVTSAVLGDVEDVGEAEPMEPDLELPVDGGDGV